MPGFPTLVRADGSFSAKGSSSADTITYRGRLTKRGTGRGYLSLFRTRIWFEGSGITSEQCFDARNWTVRRDR